MKSHKIQNAIGMVDSDLLERAQKYSKKTKRKRIRWIAPIAATLVLLIVSGVILSKGWLLPSDNPVSTISSTTFPQIPEPYTGPTSAHNDEAVNLNPFCLSAPIYPERVDYPSDDGNSNYEEWREIDKQRREYFGAGNNLSNFFTETISEFLKDSNGENKVYSPLNVYFALAMIAETTDGSTRQQVLDLLCAENIDALRTQACALWHANYQDDGLVTSKLANSLWLNNNDSYNSEMIKKLSSYYFASVFRGEMGSEDYNAALRTWINQQTEDFLSDQIQNVSFSPENIMSLVSTIYFNAQWCDEFDEAQTYKETFRSPTGDRDVDFMHETEDSMSYYWGDNFTSIGMGFDECGGMLFIRPDDDVDVNELLTDKEMLSFIMSDRVFDWKNQSVNKVNISIPKFDVASDLDLQEGLENLGVKDCFTDGEFTVLSDDSKNSEVYISDIKHTARVKVDEKGVEAAAVTITFYGAGATQPGEEIDFVLDKPFIFVIVNEEGLPLFVGVVNNP